MGRLRVFILFTIRTFTFYVATKRLFLVRISWKGEGTGDWSYLSRRVKSLPPESLHISLSSHFEGSEIDCN